MDSPATRFGQSILERHMAGKAPPPHQQPVMIRAYLGTQNSLGDMQLLARYWNIRRDDGTNASMYHNGVADECDPAAQ
jgi:uncharacterized protein affecting Mg2+/Co2+ transport